MKVASKYHQTQHDLLTELDIINAAKANPEKFEVLYNKYFEQIFHFIYQRVDDKEEGKDITQQVFCKAIVGLAEYENRGVPFSSWLYRIAQNELNMYYRESKKQRALNIDDEHLESIMEELKEDVSEKERQYDQLAMAISQLDESDAQLIEMRFFETRSFKEIGEILDITENNAKVKTYRILDKIKTLMA